MITTITYVFIILGALLFAMGYRKTHRNLMLVGAIFLTLSGGISDAVTGFSEGFNAQVGTKQTQ